MHLHKNTDTKFFTKFALKNSVIPQPAAKKGASFVDF